jgi:homopolymeric O-antigen transport system permease protein
VSGTVAVHGTAARRRLFRLTEYQELLRTLLRRELRAKYKGSVLGILWSYLNPLLLMGVYTLVFSVLWRAVDIPHYPLFVLNGLALWVFFQAALVGASRSLIENAPLITKVWFPRELAPLATVLAQAVTGAVMLAILIPIDLAIEPGSLSTFLLALPVFATFVLLTIGISWILAVANVFFRDIEHIVGAILLPWFFLTPIFYALEQLPGAAGHDHLIKLLRFGNPVTPYVETIRAVLMQGIVPGASSLVYVFAVGPAVFLLGLWVFQRYDDEIAVEL